MPTELSPDADQTLRRHVRALLVDRQAHALLDDVLDGFALDRINERVHGLPYSAWELLWHMRFAQRDILNFVRDNEYHHVPWPDGYWPAQQQASAAEWAAEVAALKQDFNDLLALLDDPQVDLFSVVPNGDQQTWLREFLLVADHNAYHVGQLALLKRLLQ